MKPELPEETRNFLGLGEGAPYTSFVRPPSFKVGGNELDEKSALERKARFQASAEMLLNQDYSKLDDVGAAALYQAVTEGMFGLADSDGKMAFGKRASANPRENLDLMRRFVKGEYNLIEDPEYAKWREMDEEGKFRYALEHEPKGNKAKSFFKGERGVNLLELAGAGMPGAQFGNFAQNAAAPNRDDVIRRTNYDSMTNEEKAAYRADVIGDYEKKLSRSQTLATYLQFAEGLSDKASYYLAKSFQDGTPDVNIEMLDEDERDRVYSAFSLMRGDQKRGRILGFETDFTDDTTAKRFQMGLYGLQQSLVGLVTDTGDLARDAAMWAYAKTAMDDAERKAFFEGWDANVRAEQAMKQSLPDAEGWFGAGFQGLMENLHWFIPYGAIGKGGKAMSAAQKTAARANLQKEIFTGARTLAMRRELAAVENYTKALQKIPAIQKAAKIRDAQGAAIWAAGEASAFSAFATEYVAAADAAGVSREESMFTAFAIGLVNAKIERLYVAGLESSLTPAQVKALTFGALANAVRSDGAAGFRKWFENRVQRGVAEGAKVTVTEGLVEEPLQRLATEHGLAFDRICGDLRKKGKTDLADKAQAFWKSFAGQLAKDYGVFVDTVCDTMPTSLAFGVTSVGRMTRRHHIHNALTRHANRRAGSGSTMLTARNASDLAAATDYDAGIVDMIQQAVNIRTAVEKHWQGDATDGKDVNPNRFAEAITAARRVYRNPQTRDAVQEIAEAAGVDVKTAEVITQYLQTEAEVTAFSPQARAFTSLRMSLADISEDTIKTVLPGYVEGSFAADPEAGVYSGRVKLGDGTERTVAYRVGDLSSELVGMVEANAAVDSNFGKSFDARHGQIGDGVAWASLSDAQRYMEALRAAASVNGFSSGKSGVFELTDGKGEKVRVNADDIIYLANGRFGDVGYGPAATMGTARHETWHSLWRFTRATMDEADVQTLAKALGVDVTKDRWEVDLDEAMAHQMEMYASGHYVSRSVSSRFEKLLDGWAGNMIRFFGQFGPTDEVRDPATGRSFALKDFYDKVLRGEIGSGKLGIEVRQVPGVESLAGNASVTAGTMPVEVTDEERAADEAETRKAAMETEKPVSGTEKSVSETPAVKVEYTAENPADASVANARYYRVGLPNSDVKIVGRLEVRDAHAGVTTSTDENYHDRGNQNRDDTSEESRALVEKIAGRPDPLQVATVQPMANNGIVWALPNGDVIIGNHRVNGVRVGYDKGTAGDLEKFVREDAAKRGIEIGEGVKAPLMVFVLERIETPEGRKAADVHEVVRLANESQNRGFNVREQAGNDAKILIDNNLLPRMAFRPDGRLDETKCADAIGKFRQESGAQGLVGEDGMLTEEGQTRIQNAALAALLSGTGNNALLQRIMTNAGHLDITSQLRALMKMTPELMALAEAKKEFDLRDALADALTLYTEWREKDEEKRVEKGKSRHDWREIGKDGKRVRGLSWEAFMSQGDMFRKPSEEAQILGDMFAKTEELRSFDREDVESAAGKKRVVDLISDYLGDYIANARAVNTETDDMFGTPPASRTEVLAAQRAVGENGARFSMAVRLDEERRELATKGGVLVLAHHGTDSAGFTVFEKTDDKGYFFAKSRTTAGSYIRDGQRADVNRKALPDYEQILKEKEDEGWIEHGFALVNEDGSLSGQYGSRWGDKLYEEHDFAKAFSAGRQVVAAKMYHDEIYREEDRIPYRDLLESEDKRSGVYDVALRMEDPYIIDCKGANWDSIIDWDEVESRPDTVVYERIAIEREDGHFYLELREHGQEESNYESFATVGDIVEWAKTNLGEEIADRCAVLDGVGVEDGYHETLANEEMPYAFDSAENEGWYLQRKKTRDVVSDAFYRGCDGVIFKNVVDNGGGVVDAYEDDVYVVKDSKQVKLVDEMTYADDGSIIPAEQRLNWNNPDIRFSLASPVERRKDLIAVHNLNPSDLVAAAELEGLPAPSIAVVKDTMGFEEYGPISFVFRSDTINPKFKRQNQIYSSDAWTPTRGNVRIEYKVLLDKLGEIVESMARGGDSAYQEIFRAFANGGSLESSLERHLENGDYYPIQTNEAVALAYLNGKGQTVSPEYREVQLLSGYSNAVVKGVSDSVGDQIAEIWENGGKNGDEEAVERMSELMRPAAVTAKDNENPEGAAGRRAKGVPTLGERLYGAGLKNPLALARAVMSYRENGFRKAIDEYAVGDKIRKMLSAEDPAYQKWVRDTFAPAVGGRGIRNEKDVFAPSGNRRTWESLHDRVMAQRIVDMMYRGRKKIGVGSFASTSPEGASVRTYASIAEMRQDKDRLRAMPEDEWKKLQEETRKDFLDSITLLQSIQKGSYDDNPFIELDIIQDIVLEAFIDAKGDKSAYVAQCKEELHKYHEESVSGIWDVMMRLRNAPTKYFEAKPERVVGFDEIVFAVIPDDSDAETVEILKRLGVDSHTYKSGDSEERLRVLNEAADATDTRFSVSVGDTLMERGRFDRLKNAITAQSLPENALILDRTAKPQEAAELFADHILGKTFHLSVGGDFTFNAGHFFRLVCSGKDGRKGFVDGFTSGEDAFAAILAGKVEADRITGWEAGRARLISLVPDLLTKPSVVLEKENISQFVKRYDVGNGKTLTAVFRAFSDGRKILSFHPTDFRYGELKQYRVAYMDDAIETGTSPATAENNHKGLSSTPHIIQNQTVESNGISVELFDAMQRRAEKDRGNAGDGHSSEGQETVFSTATPDATGGLFPSLQSMSDDELVTAAIAVRMALGNSDKISDRSVKINTVNKMIRRLHPEYGTTDVGRESNRVIADARKFARKIREDLDRGVSESLVLEHLPRTAREQFGREMLEEARKGQRLGRFGQKVASTLEDRQARIVEDAVRVQTGIDVSLMESTYGINLSETLMHLAENPFAGKPHGASGEAEKGEGVDDGESAEGDETPAVEVGEAVKKAVAEIVSAAGSAAEANERNRADRRAAAGRDKEREAEMNASDDSEGGAGEDFGGDIVAVATRKAGIDLENPRHLAEFVAELTRRYWIKEHSLAETAEVWRDLVALQFLRKTAQTVYAKLCRELTYSRSRETAMSHIAKLDNVPTVQGLLSEMEFVGALINAQRIRDTQKALCEKLDLFLRQKFGAQGRFKPDKEEGKRNVSAEAELRARYMRHAMWLTPDAAADEARALQETLDALSVDFKDVGRDVDQSREFIETIRKLNVLREFGALRYKPIGEIEAAARWWEDFERGESDDIVREMSDRDIRTKKAAHLLAVAFADPDRKTMREDSKFEDYITGHMGFVALLNDCMRHASDADREAVKNIVDYIAREVQKAGDGTAAEKRRNNDAFHAAVETIYARSFNKVMKDMMAVDERFMEFMGETGGVKVPPTKARAMQLLVSLLQEGRKVEVEDEDNPGKTKTVWEGGYHDNIVRHKREGQAEKIMKLLTPADMNMVKWLGMWYDQNRQDLSTVCQKLFGIGVYAELPNYFPVKMQLEKQGLEKGEAVGWTIFPKALTPRVRNERDFDTSADIFQMWSSRMEEGAQWKHHAQIGLELRGIFGRSELQSSVVAHHGQQVNSLMQGFITDILAGKGTVDRSMAGTQYFSDKVRGWTALCALGGNVGVMFKQMTGIPAFGFEIGLANTARHFVSAFTADGIAAMARIWNSEQRKTRWDVGNSEAVANALKKEDADLLKRMFQAAMITNKLGDAVPGLVIGQGIYRDCLERGMSEADAMAETWMIVERTQQSSRMENLASMQRRSRLGRTMFQFLSTQRQYLDYEMRAIRDVIANPSSVKRWGTLGRTLILNHFILTSAYYWMGQLYKAMLGQEPPEDELTDWVITCLLGPFGSMFVAGFCCNYTLQRALKGYSYGGGQTMLPMESWLTNQINDGSRLVEAIFSAEGASWEEMLDAAGKWMSDFNSTFRDLRKIYRFRVKEEKQKKKK